MSASCARVSNPTVDDVQNSLHLKTGYREDVIANAISLVATDSPKGRNYESGNQCMRNLQSGVYLAYLQ